MRHTLSCWYLCMSALLLLVLAHSSQAQLLVGPKRTAIIKSDTDTRDYRYLTLSNQLNILLVSDTSVEKSAVALNVHVGNHQNSQLRPGLAHFVERMLVSSSEKYPVVGDYQGFIRQHNGDVNASTAADNTQYYFDIDSTYLEPALDRFAQFFIAPSFDVSNVEPVKNIINAEYLAAMNDDTHREWDVYRGLLNKDHPASIFSDGNTEVLADRENQSVHDDAVNFYKNYYSANVMSLVIVSNQSLDNLQKMIEERFALIPNNNKIIETAAPALFTEGTLPISVAIKPIKDTRELSFVFPVPSYLANYQTKPWAYVAHLLNGESAGGLLSLLKTLGWAESLTAGELLTSRQGGLFKISIALTAEGLQAKDQITSTVFEYFKILTARGINDWRFNEIKQMAELGFRFNEKSSPIQTAIELAQAMHDYPAKDVLWGKYNYSTFDENLIKTALGYLRKDNVIITCAAPAVNTTAESAYYHAPYSAVHGVPELLELKSVYRQKLSLPERNIFIPKNTAVKAPSMQFAQGDAAAKNNPSLILSDDQYNLWFLQDQYYRSPKAVLNFRFTLPELNSSLENAARTHLFVALVMDQLNEYVYAANAAGLTFTITANPRGFDMYVMGYTDKQSLLVNKIVGVIAQTSFTQNRFETFKDKLINDWRNDDKNMSSALLLRKISRLQYTPYWDVSEYANALQKTSFSGFKSFAKQLLRDAKIESLFYGNLYSQDAIKLAALVDHQLLKQKANQVPQSAKGFRTDNKNNKSWLYINPIKNGDHAVALYVPALSPTIGSAAQTLLLNQLLQPALSQQLRNDSPSNLSVSLLPLSLKNLESSVFVLQSPVAPSEQMIESVTAFLTAAPSAITGNFVQAKSTLLTQMRKVPASLIQQSEKFWQSVLLGDITFSRHQELIAAVAASTPESLLGYYENTFLQKNRRLWLSTDGIENGKDFEIIRNVTEYQQKQQGYLYP